MLTEPPEEELLFRLRIPCAGLPWLNMNDRMHHMARSRLVKKWREMTKYQWLAQGRPGPQPPSVIFTTLIFTRPVTRDAGNFMATTKPIIDELVKLGVWPNDDGRYIDEHRPRLVVNSKSARGVILRAYPQEPR